jgi:hypothetical protein
MEDDLAAIFRVAHSATRRDRDLRAPLILLLLLVCGAFSLVATRLVPKRDAQQSLPTTVPPAPLPNAAYIATTPTVPVPAAIDASPAPNAPAATVVIPLRKSRPAPGNGKRHRTLRSAPPTETAAIVPLPASDAPKVTQERLTRQELDQKGETRDIRIKPIEVRSSRLEAVDAIRTLRFR